MNRLYYGDNLGVLQNHIEDESVDLIYLDPPFNSNRNYNVLFREKTGTDSPAQIKAFGDTWRWDEAAVEAFHRIVENAPDRVSKMVESLRYLVGDNDMMAYLVMMTERMVELHRVLKPTGSIYLHCDPTASHYLKLVMDTIFGIRNFRNEIVWRRTNSHNDPKKFGRVHDVLLFYAKDSRLGTWNPVFEPYSHEYVDAEFRTDSSGRVYKLEDLTAPYRGGSGGRFDFHGRVPGPTRMWAKNQEWMEELWDAGRIKTGKDGKPLLRGHIVYMDEKRGAPVQDWWGDILRVGNTSKERLGYPTQKPLALLDRILQASSNPGDIVLDPFCGCGTAVAAAQKLDRQWIGIDITHLAVSLMQNRLFDMFGDAVEYEVIGTPVDLGSARRLAEDDRYEFQAWANSLVHAHPLDGREKKGPDKGIDGIIRFIDDDKETVKRVIVQVKSNDHVGRPVMEQLRGTIEREKEPMGLLVSLNRVTRQAEEEALAAGFYESMWWGERYPKLQVFCIEEHFDGREPRIPPSQATFYRAQRLRGRTHEQPGLFD